MTGQLTIAAQLSNFRFQSWGKQHGIDHMDTLFQDGWRKQLQDAASSWAKPKTPNSLFFPYISGFYANPIITVAETHMLPEVEQPLIEYWGVDFGLSFPGGQLGTMADQQPWNVVVAFGFSLEAFLHIAKAFWVFLLSLSPSGRFSPLSPGVSTDGLPVADPNGPIELLSLGMNGTNSGQGAGGVITEIKGLFHTPSGFPDVPFSVTTTETIGPGNDSYSLPEYSVSSNLAYDDSALRSAVQALEAVLGGAALTLATGLGTPILAGLSAAGLAAGVSEIDRTITSQEPASGPTMPLGFLKFVFQTIPAKLLVPNAREKVVIPALRFAVPLPDPTPAGGSPLALWDGKLNEQVFVDEPTALMSFAGYPQLVAREAFLIIEGESAFEFSPGTQSVVRTYQALTTDDVQNPVFSDWRVLDAHGQPSARAQLSSTSGQKVQITFDVRGIPRGSSLTWTIAVSMDDDLHLTDSAGKAPTAQVQVVGTPMPPVHSVPPPHRPLRPLPVEE